MSKFLRAAIAPADARAMTAPADARAMTIPDVFLVELIMYTCSQIYTLQYISLQNMHGLSMLANRPISM